MTSPTRSTRLTRVGLAVLGAAALLAASVVPTASAAPVDQRQAQLNAALALQPGGVQVSDNAVAWRGGEVVLVVPDAGTARAPEGLGSNVRSDRLTTPLMKGLAATSLATTGGAVTTAATTAAAAPALAAAVNGCPGGLFVTDYYCFYTDINFGGRRLQFTGNTRFDTAANWGFNNQVSSWVANDVDCTVTAFNAGDGTSRLWTEPENSRSSWVGNTNNDKLSSWTC
jgi:Peptidase inhibitor family I36